MSISAAMWAAVTGLSALSTGMQVISNNIANVNTVGFKAARTNFEDLISQDYLSNGRIQQIGRGVKVASVQQMFTQGAFINSAQDTDMAIAGEGFFQVRDRVTNELMYTRAGNFTFDKDGYLETPAGYVLQGWELSIPKPGQDPVRIGVPTDVKVIQLNAPPLETSQIKVVVNLNADDSSAYIYSSAEFAEMYADQLAKGPAESARAAAEKLVYSFASGSSAFPNAYSAFNRAYIDFMAASPRNYTYSAGTFTKIGNPSPTEMQDAQISASASAWALFAVVSSAYPSITTTSPSYDTAFETAFLDYMNANFKLSAGTFVRKTGYSTPTQAFLQSAVAVGVASAIAAGNAGYTGYTDGTAPGDDVYASAYTHFLESKGYVRPVANYTEMPPTAAEFTAADAAGRLASSAVTNTGTFAGYPATPANALADLAYAAAYAASLDAAKHPLSATTYTLPPLPSVTSDDLFANAVTSAINSAQTLNDPGFVGYDDPTGMLASTNLAYLKYLFNHMTSAATVATNAAATAWLSTIPTSYEYGTTELPTLPAPLAFADQEYDDAHQAGLAAAQPYSTTPYTTYPSGDPSTNPAADIAYLQAFALSLEGDGYFLDPSVLPAAPTAAVFAVSSDAETSARAAGLLAAKALHAAYADYNTSTPPDPAGDLAYADAYAKKMVALGLTTTYAGPPTINTATLYADRAVGVVDKYYADQAARLAARTNANAPTDYAYPTGNQAWDDEYIQAYDSYFPTNSKSLMPLSTFQTFTATQEDLDKAAEEAHKIARASMALSDYPIDVSTYPDTAMANRFNTEYLNKMLLQGYTPISPQPTSAPYFEKDQNPTPAEMLAAQAAAKAAAELAAKNAGQAAYDQVYNFLFDSAVTAVKLLFPDWQLEGMGFAGAWDGTDLSSPMDPENYTHANPWTIYDSLGTAHTLMVYYQPNPYMENVWDYIITCDPTEDARKDLNNSLVMNGASFAGIIQKGKITFTADGEDRHGGLIKDIEAQNIDMSKTARALLSSASATVAMPATSSSMNYYTFGGYYTGSPSFSAATGSLVATDRTYSIEWAGNLSVLPAVSGFTWTDDAGNHGTIPVYDINNTGPYAFGSGLSVSFHKGGTPMRFTVGDTLAVTAKSEEIGWTNLQPNTEGYFDFDVAFVQSASLSMHPPYPEGLPTIIQHIALDMGARYANPGDPADPYLQRWILDEQSTTQYATKSLNIFSSQDGYPPGSLQRVSIDSDGTLTGIYTNGRHQPLYQIGLTRFMNPWGLAKLGDNVYMETRWSGVGVINPPGYGGTGTIRANFLEQSNTDIADEIVNMIATQRGFQANSKVVTTTDTMLAEVIEMKR
ncbi:MAG: flagellar hook-basal body complex protein [Deltaproteobacteria bacterium]|nr:flagellar hook-basal body complex protein [Deltaproteobacteria bacterium]